MPADHWLVTTSHFDMNSFVEAAVYFLTIYIYILSQHSLHRFSSLEEQQLSKCDSHHSRIFSKRQITAMSPRPRDPQQHPIRHPIRSPRIDLSSVCHERYDVPGKRSGVSRIMRVLSILEQGQRASSVFNTLCDKAFLLGVLSWNFANEI